MSGIMRRKAATRTMPIPSSSPEQHPASPSLPPPSPPLTPPSTPPSLQDEDVPAAKRPRPETSIISVDSDSDADSDIISIHVASQSTTRTAAAPHQNMGNTGATTSRVPASECESLAQWMQHWNAIAPTVLDSTPAKESEYESLTEWMQYWNTVAPIVLGSLPTKQKAASRGTINNFNSDPNNINDLTTIAMPPQRGPFTLEEDAKLILAVKQLGYKDWVAVAALVPGRTRSQCRLRWVCVLDPAMTRQSKGWQGKENPSGGLPSHTTT
jgi:hypothetical protein